MMFRRRNDSGFSLIELAMLMVIIGALTAAALDTYRVWFNRRMKDDTDAGQQFIITGLQKFLATYGRLPVPADPALNPDAPLAGYESTGAALPADGTCVSGVCSVQGYRDRSPVNGVNDYVYVGAIPYAAMGMTIKDSADVWGNKLIYAVSKSLTVKTSFNFANGVIRLSKGARNPTTGVLTVSPTGYSGAGGVPNSFPFIVVSVGPDGKGAYNYEGKIEIPCGGAARDVENCDGDAEFIEASHSTDIYNTVPGAEFFDDAWMIFTIDRQGDKWTYSTTDTMTNKYGQKVGIGTPTPAYTLDVGGQIALNNYQASQYCSLPETSPVAKPSYCFEPDMLGGTGVHCATGASSNVMTGIDSTVPVCVNTINTAVIAPTSVPCPGGQFMKGINALGEIVCVTPP